MKAFGIGLGQAAVAVFFLLSGFVLMYTTSDAPLDFRRYGKRRIVDFFRFSIWPICLRFWLMGCGGGDSYSRLGHGTYIYLPWN